MGTPGYLAPEVIEGKDGGQASDVHSWGSTLAFAATGRPPFGTGSFEAIFYRIVHGQPDLARLLRRCSSCWPPRCPATRPAGRRRRSWPPGWPRSTPRPSCPARCSRVCRTGGPGSRDGAPRDARSRAARPRWAAPGGTGRRDGGRPRAPGRTGLSCPGRAFRPRSRLAPGLPYSTQPFGRGPAGRGASGQVAAGGVADLLPGVQYGPPGSGPGPRWKSPARPPGWAASGRCSCWPLS